MEFLFVIMTLVVGINSQLTFKVTPKTVEPGVTPSMTLICALLENEDLTVLTITISRKLTRKEGSVQETVATINSLAPKVPRTLIRTARVNVFGQIFGESENSSYLKVIWPRPNADDLGLYTCEAQVLGEFGELVPLKAEAQLSSSNPIQDRLLTIVQLLVSKLEGLDQTLASLENRLDNVTSKAVESERALLDRLATLANQTSALLTGASVEGTTAARVETTGAPVETTAGRVETTAAPVETTAARVEITAAQVETTTAYRRFPPRRRPIYWRRTTSETLTSVPAETTSFPKETTVAQRETTAAAPETTAAVAGETTAASGETTAAAGETTEAAGETSAAAGDTTVTASETTEAADETSAAADETTLSPEEATDILEDTELLLEELLATTASSLETDTTATITLRETQLIEFLAAVRILVSRLDAVNTSVVELEEKVHSIEAPVAEPAENKTNSNIADSELFQARIEELTTLLDTMNSTVIILEQKLETLEAKVEVNESNTNTNANTANSELENEVNETESEQVVTINKLTQTIEVLTSQLEQFNVTVQVLEEKVAGYKVKGTAGSTHNKPRGAAERRVGAGGREELEAEGEARNEPVEPAENEAEGEQETTHTLVATVEVLSNKLDTVNATLSAIENKLAILESKEAENVTKPEPAEDLRRYFVTIRSTYFLIKGSDNTDSYKAQAVCESKQLYLAEINDQAEFDVIEIEIAPFVVDDWPVIVAGKRRSGRNDWIWQSSGNKVTYFTWGAGEPVMASLNNDCLALKTVGGLAEMVAVPCYVERSHFYFLCERDL